MVLEEMVFHYLEADQAVTGVAYIDGDPAKGALITIETRVRYSCCYVTITQSNGRTETLQLPVNICIGAAAGPSNMRLPRKSIGGPRPGSAVARHGPGE